MKSLPDLPSALLSVALADLEKAEADSRYLINMGAWHLPDAPHPGKCGVCFAGAVMAFELDVSPMEYASPMDFPNRIYDRLCALDCFRCGHIHSGLRAMNIVRPAGVPDRVEVVRYGDHPASFKLDMKMIAELLRSNGL